MLSPTVVFRRSDEELPSALNQNIDAGYDGDVNSSELVLVPCTGLLMGHGAASALVHRFAVELD